MHVSPPRTLARIGNTFLGQQHSSFRFQLLFLAFFSLSPSGWGQSPSVSVTLAPETIAVGQNTTLTITISSHQQLEAMAPPNLGSLLPVSFQAFYLGTKNQYNNINAQSSVSKIWSYSLIPQEEGSFTISDIVLPFNGKNFQIQPITIIVKSKIQLQNQTGSQKRTWSQNVFNDPFYGGSQKIEASVDNQFPYVGEQITYTFRYLHTAIIPSVDFPKYQLPSMNQFWRYQLGQPKPKTEIINGTRFRVAEIKIALFPMVTGIITIAPSVLSLSASIERSNRSIPRQLKTEGMIEVMVRPLLETGKPTSFEGVVGRYQITSEVEKTKVKIGEAITMHIRIAGIGNIETLPELKIPEMIDLTIYDSNITDATQDTNGEIYGSRTYEYVIIPSKPGRVTIPVIEFCYFDPNEEKYEIIRTTPIPLKISPETTTKTKITQLDSSMLDTSKVRTGMGLYKIFAWSFGVLFIGVIGVIYIIKIHNHKQSQADKQKSRQLNAYANALTILNQARSFADLANAIYSYISDSFQSSSVGLNPEIVKRQLLLENVSELSADEMVRILRECDMAIFTPITSQINELKATVEQAKSVVGRIEEELSKKEETKNANKV